MNLQHGFDFKSTQSSADDSRRFAENLLASQANPSHQKLTVKQVFRRDINPTLIARWRDLQSRSCHSNAFLSPDFLLPSWKYLDPQGSSFLLTVEEASGGRMLALGCFEQSFANRSLPLRHLVAAKTIHTYRTGFLLDDKQSDVALDTWLNFVRNQSIWNGVEFPSLRLESILAQRLQKAVARAGLPWHTSGEYKSAALFPPIASAENIDSHLSTKRSKSLRKKLNGLASLGRVRMRQVEQCDDPLPAVERFLELEHAGWKGRLGTSLQSSSSNSNFLRMMTAVFHRRGKLLMTQMLVGDEVAATAVSLIGGTTVFTFKIGWNPKFAKASPGVLHMQMMMPMICERFPEITCLDSCSRPGSFFENLWPHRIPIGNALIPTTSLAQGVVVSLSAARRMLGRIARSSDT